jgi:hypothetical protein
MGALNLEEIKPGMILAGDVRDRNGLILLTSGCEISEKHLRILKMWGVVEVDIQGVSREELIRQAAEEVDPLLLREAENQSRQWFRHADLKHPFVSELFRLVTLRRVFRKGEGNHLDG